MVHVTSPAFADDRPVLRAGVFNTTGTLFPTAGHYSPFLWERMMTLASALPSLLENDLDVVCLNDLTEPFIRNIALENVLNNPAWHVYQPAPLAQPGCAQACFEEPLPSDPDYPPIGLWASWCSSHNVTFLGHSCQEFANGLEYQQCLLQVCPQLLPFAGTRNPTCGYCLEDDRSPSETTEGRVSRCTSSYDPDSASQCRFALGGEAAGTLISRYPFIATEYHPFTEPASSAQPGLTNRGITYGKVQSPHGPVHLFCGNMATTASGMNPAAAESLNAAQSQEVLEYIRAKANGEMAVFMADTGSGPAVASSPWGPVQAKWPTSFATLQTELSDALLDNLDDGSLPLPAASCTHGCNTSAPGTGSYVDHIMTSGQGTPDPSRPRYKSNLQHRRGGLFFTSNVVPTWQGPTRLSDHFGVRTDIHLDVDVEVSLAGTHAILSDPGNAKSRSTNISLSDAAINLTGVDPRVTGATAYIGREGGPPQTLVMPAAGWTKTNGRIAEYRFSSRTGPVISAHIRDGKFVNLLARGPGAYALGGPQGTVGVIFEIGGTRFCGTFGGTISRDNGKQFLARRAPVSGNCPAL
jgi:hypothetical protein